MISATNIQGVDHGVGWKHLSSRYRLKNFPIPVQIQFEDRYGSPTLLITFMVPDRNTGKPAQISSSYPIDSIRLIAQLDDVVYREVRRAVQHEVDEAWHVDDRRVFDPHRGER